MADAFNLAGEVAKTPEPIRETRMDETREMFPHRMIERATGRVFNCPGKNPTSAKFQAAKLYGGKPSDFSWDWKHESGQ